MASRLKLGLFGTNMDGGLTATVAKERYQLSWDACVRTAQIADDAGLELNLPLARWAPLTPTSQYNGTSYETVAWAAGLAACTRHSQVFATIHAPFVHPVVAAKQLATIDHISGGRAGVNVVLSASDSPLFDYKSPPQAEKYALATKWVTALKRQWASPPTPVQTPHPPIMNAGFSAESAQFAAQYADVALRRLDGRDYAASAVEYAAIRRTAADSFDRTIEVWVPCFILCRSTRQEAERVFERVFTESADPEYTARLNTVGLTAAEIRRLHVGYGHEALVGAPEDIAEGLERIAGLGVDGVALFFLDYLAELPPFVDEVMPALIRRGLRRSPTA